MVGEISIFWTSTEGKSVDITKLCEEIEWSESNSSHTMELSFMLPDTDEAYLEHLTVTAGDKLQLLYNGKTMYCFIVTQVGRTYPKRSVKAVDFCFYIENNEVVIQFRGQSVKKCCEELCSMLGISKYEICEMPKPVSGVYIDSAESIIEELLKLQELSDGKKYSYEMQGDTFVIYRLSDEALYYGYKDAVNVNEFDVTKHHSRVSCSSGIEKMKNTVTAIVKNSSDDRLPIREYTVSDKAAVSRYGKLAKVLNINKDDAEEIEVLAGNELYEKDKSEIKITCDMPGNINARVNRVMNFEDEYTGLNALMRIVGVSHSYSGGIYKMSLELEFLKDNQVREIVGSEIKKRKDVKKSTSKSAVRSAEFEHFYGICKKYLGVPYVWGGYSPNGFDCSGFVCYVLKEGGLWDVGRTTAQGLYDSTQRVDEPEPGDLVFWSGTNPSSPNYITHVGICIGYDKNIQASSSKRKVVVCRNTGACAYGRF